MNSAPLRCALPLILATFAAPAAAQDRDTQLWSQTGVTVRAGEFDLGAHFIARASDAADGIYQIQFGVDAERELSAGITGGVGYSYVPSYDQGSPTTREHRIRQQVSVPLAKVAGGKVGGRLRLEQRWRDDGEDTKFRLRPRVTWTRPIGPDALEVRLLHESFLNLNDTDWGDEARYDRMRHQVALRRDIGPGLKAEIGYLNQYIFQGERPDEMDHALTFSISLSR